ncbi:MAG: LuxR C-terminal-related transcriptional regulator [Acidobacteriota bacterium]
MSLERLHIFQAAFLADPRPGLVLEYGRLVLANEAAKRLLASAPAAGALLRALKAVLSESIPDPGLCFQLGMCRFLLELYPSRSRAGHSARICFLVKQTAMAPALRELTDRERGVVTWFVKGATNREIAQRLGISVETVRKHVANALKRTGTRTRAGLVGRALRRYPNTALSGPTQRPSGREADQRSGA